MSYNTWIHKFSRQFVKPLVDTPVTPNHLTTGRLVFGVVAAVCFAFSGNPIWDWSGAICFLISMVLDRADGELARLSGKSSQFGALYDLVTDAICNSALFVGIGTGLTNSSLGNWSILLGIIAGLFIIIIFLASIQLTNEAGTGEAAAFNSLAGFDPDDAMVLVPIGILLGLAQHLLIAAAVITPIVSVFILKDLSQRRKKLRTEKS